MQSLSQQAKKYYDGICSDLAGGRIIDASWGPFDDPAKYSREDLKVLGGYVNGEPCIRIRVAFDEPREMKSGFMEKGFLVTELEFEIWQDDEGNGPGSVMFTEAKGYERSKR